jgi:hypothetical protein
MPKRKPLRAGEDSKFDAETLKGLVKDLQTGRYATIGRFTISDDRVTGLRAMVTKDGRITLHASYHCGDERPMLKLGELNVPPKHPDYISVDDARELTKVIKALGDKGIDPQDGLQRRLIKELKRDGTDWRPDKLAKK